MADRARVHYNLGLLLQHLKQDLDAEAALLKARELEPDNFDYLYALDDFYLKRNKLQQARSIAEEMVARHPDQRIGYDILKLIEKDFETRSNWLSESNSPQRLNYFLICTGDTISLLDL